MQRLLEVVHIILVRFHFLFNIFNMTLQFLDIGILLNFFHVILIKPKNLVGFLIYIVVPNIEFDLATYKFFNISQKKSLFLIEKKLLEQTKNNSIFYIFMLLYNNFFFFWIVRRKSLFQKNSSLIQFLSKKSLCVRCFFI